MSAGILEPVGIAGIGVVTPLGFDVDEVARRIARGERGNKVQNFDILDFTKSDRLRRSPPVSLFAVAAASRALDSAGLAPGSFDGARVGVIAAVAKGATLYSARFHAQFVQGGAKAVVPLLFPETVANAPASHVASVLGLQGPNATLLGDAAVAHNAIAMARDWLDWETADRVLVVAPHEHADILIKGYASFRRLFHIESWSEGAGALLLTRGEGPLGTIVHVDRGFPFRRRREIPALFESALRALPAEPAVVAVSGLEPSIPFASAPRFAIKDALGEAFVAGALWQIVFGLRETPAGRHLLSTCVGLNEQVSVLMARR
jgi:hypothetical protein